MWRGCSAASGSSWASRRVDLARSRLLALGPLRGGRHGDHRARSAGRRGDLVRGPACGGRAHPRGRAGSRTRAPAPSARGASRSRSTGCAPRTSRPRRRRPRRSSRWRPRSPGGRRWYTRPGWSEPSCATTWPPWARSWPKRVVDTTTLFRLLCLERGERDPGLCSLGAVASALGLPSHRPHVAEGDALTTAQVFLALATHLEAHGHRTLRALTGAERRLRERELWLPPG